jgi:nucleoside phosphorylase
MVAAAKRAQVPVAIIRVVSDTWFGDRAKSLPNFLKEASALIDRIIRIGYMEPSEKSPTIL